MDCFRFTFEAFGVSGNGIEKSMLRGRPSTKKAPGLVVRRRVTGDVNLPNEGLEEKNKGRKEERKKGRKEEERIRRKSKVLHALPRWASGNRYE